jgi:hypothetical protein
LLPPFAADIHLSCVEFASLDILLSAVLFETEARGAHIKGTSIILEENPLYRKEKDRNAVGGFYTFCLSLLLEILAHNKP